MLKCLSFVRKLGSFTLVLAILLLAVYVVFCGRVASLSSLPVKKQTLLVGIAKEVYPASGVGGLTVYRLADPTGKVFILSRNGPPRRGAIMIVRGAKSLTDEGRAIVIEQYRLSTF